MSLAAQSLRPTICCSGRLRRPLSANVMTHVTPEFERKLQQTLNAFEAFARGRPLAVDV